VDVSTVFYSFEYHKIGALLQNIKIPLCDLRVIRFPVWSVSTKQVIDTALSTKQVIDTALSLGSGALGGMASFAL
jgi:hypothetical protein